MKHLLTIPQLIIICYNLADGIKGYDVLSSECSFVGYEFQEKFHVPFFPSSARHVKVENTGHYMINTKAEESLRIIRGFLEE